MNTDSSLNIGVARCLDKRAHVSITVVLSGNETQSRNQLDLYVNRRTNDSMSRALDDSPTVSCVSGWADENGHWNDSRRFSHSGGENLTYFGF